jgi:hypothetical protein
MNPNDWWKDAQYNTFERIVTLIRAWLDAHQTDDPDSLEWKRVLARNWSRFLQRQERRLKGQGNYTVVVNRPPTVGVEGVLRLYYELHDPYATHRRPITEYINVRGELSSDLDEDDLRWQAQSQVLHALFGDPVTVTASVSWVEFNITKGKQK